MCRDGRSRCGGGQTTDGDDGASNDVAGDVAGAAELSLRVNEDVRAVLVLAEEGKVEDDLDGGGVGSEDNDLGGTAVEGLGGLVGTTLQLTLLVGRRHKIVDGLLEGAGLRPDTGASIIRHLC